MLWNNPQSNLVGYSYVTLALTMTFAFVASEQTSCYVL